MKSRYVWMSRQGLRIGVVVCEQSEQEVLRSQVSPGSPFVREDA